MLRTWPIDSICQPGGGPAQPDRTVVKGLGDDTFIIEQLGRCLRVRYRECHTKCLPPDARIATPSGEIAVRDVRIGIEIWTQDGAGHRVLGRVSRVSTTRIRGEHHVVRLVLADGRSLVASPEHPVLDHRLAQDLHAGDVYDGARVVTVELQRYAGDATYDLLPSGDTGVYWADRIPVRSTLATEP